jgi:hypothetical protein
MDLLCGNVSHTDLLFIKLGFYRIVIFVYSPDNIGKVRVYLLETEK